MIKTGYGAKAKVLIKYVGTLHDLGNKIRNDLLISDWHYDTDMFPPHNEFAMGEALGFEFWLNRIESEIDFNYLFSFSTSKTNLDTFGKNHSLSDWMTSYFEALGYKVLSVPWEYDLGNVSE